MDVRYRQVCKSFGAHQALAPLDLHIADGKLLALLGPSGCGKTTALRLLAGLERPTSGQIFIGERDVTYLATKDRDIAMVFQSYALYPHLSVYRNIAFPLRARGADRRTIAEKVRWAAGMFGIERLLARKPRQLSGGERQRVALARAVVRQPLAFLLDEPLSNLDAKLRTLARDELKQFQRRIGTTTIYVTHDQIEAMGLGDRIAVLSEGRVRQIGTPREIYSDPARSLHDGCAHLGHGSISSWDCQQPSRMGPILPRLCSWAGRSACLTSPGYNASVAA